MIESAALKITAYLRKERREKDYSSELTTPPSLEETGTNWTRDTADERWRQKLKRFFPSSRTLINPATVVRCVLEPFPDPTRLKPIYAMDETSGHTRVSDIDFRVRNQMIVEDEEMELHCQMLIRGFLMKFKHFRQSTPTYSNPTKAATKIM